MKKRKTALTEIDGTKYRLTGHDKVSKKHQQAGSLKGRTAVQLDGKTVIFVHPSKDTQEVINRYENRNINFKP